MPFIFVVAVGGELLTLVVIDGGVLLAPVLIVVIEGGGGVPLIPLIPVLQVSHASHVRQGVMAVLSWGGGSRLSQLLSLLLNTATTVCSHVGTRLRDFTLT